MIEHIGDRDQAILIQNAFPTIEKYIMSEHTINGKAVVVPTLTQKRIVDNFRSILRLKERGNNLFFTDIDKIKQIMLDDLK